MPTLTTFRPVLESMTSVQRKQVCLMNPCLFGEYYIRPYTRKWNTDTAEFQAYMIEEALRHQNTVIHVPVEHAKSTWFSLVLALWFIYTDRNSRGSILSCTSRQAQGFLAKIRWHIEFNERLKQDFADHIIPDPKGRWTDEQIFVARDAAEQSKDPTVLAVGTEGAIYGARLDWIIADDILDLSNSQTAHMREKVSDWWYQMVDSRVVENGRKIVLGTLQDPADLLCELSKDPTFHYVHLPAIDTDGNALWPAQWPIERLSEKKSSIGTRRFGKIFQNDRDALRGNIFNKAWFQAVNAYEVPTLKCMGWAWDLALTEGKKADYSCGVLVGMSDENDIYVLDVRRGQWNSTEVKKQLIKAWRDTKDVWGRKLQWMLAEDCQEGRVLQGWIKQDAPDIPVELAKTGGRSKYARASEIIPFCEAGRVKIQKGRWNEDFLDELERFTDDDSHEHDDQVDPTVYGCRKLFLKPTNATPRIMVM